MKESVKLSWYNKYITPLGKDYRDFEREIKDTSAELFFKDGERSFSKREELFLEIFNFKNGIKDNYSESDNINTKKSFSTTTLTENLKKEDVLLQNESYNVKSFGTKDELVQKLMNYYTQEELPSMWYLDKPVGANILDFCLDIYRDERLVEIVSTYISLEMPIEPELSDYTINDAMINEEMYERSMDQYDNEKSEFYIRYEKSVKDLEFFGTDYKYINSLKIGIADLGSFQQLIYDLKNKFNDYVSTIPDVRVMWEERERKVTLRHISEYLDNYIPGGEISCFPKPVISKMLENLALESDIVDVEVFELDKSAGFDWEKSPEGYGFWEKVIKEERFDLFFTEFELKDPNIRELEYITHEIKNNKSTMEHFSENKLNTESKNRLEEIQNKIKPQFPDQYAYEQWLLQNNDLLHNPGFLLSHHVNKIIISVQLNQYDDFKKFLQENGLDKNKSEKLLDYVSKNLLKPDSEIFKIKEEIREIFNKNQPSIYNFMVKLNDICKHDKKDVSLKI